ncbi:Tellurite resistance protein TerB [Salegentibacter agarivorans]|jgi:uncharacterized tellurite resistance protein B-like protein|uniref:Tellurite resistance protein TerB n=2 Tax=Flavobacteriaceae TaxID=49546 RepID=A0A1I2PGH1_9FLAO|nr:Tellurite resistance protein TerB [Salegentibacter agarivorans]|tara:strand:+ start:395 stop:868 length:474 start_codon:yes stop_codon:yes gene_type:complete
MNFILSFKYICSTKILKMSFSDLFDSGEHLRNINHFASIVNLASVDGKINEKERVLLERFARKLDISEQEYKMVIKRPAEFPINSYNSAEKRLERLHDLFKIIFADNEIDNEEETLIKRYAIGLGFSSENAEKIIKRSIQIFSGQLNFEDYQYLLDK